MYQVLVFGADNTPPGALFRMGLPYVFLDRQNLIRISPERF